MAPLDWLSVRIVCANVRAHGWGWAGIGGDEGGSPDPLTPTRRHDGGPKGTTGDTGRFTGGQGVAGSNPVIPTGSNSRSEAVSEKSEAVSFPSGGQNVATGVATAHILTTPLLLRADQ